MENRPFAQRLERLEALVKRALASGFSALAALGGATIQRGSTTLVAGSSPAIAATITATSRIVVTMKNPGAGAITGLGAFDTGSARVVGAPGSFVIRAIDDAKVVIATAVCDVDWVVVN